MPPSSDLARACADMARISLKDLHHSSYKHQNIANNFVQSVALIFAQRPRHRQGGLRCQIGVAGRHREIIDELENRSHMKAKKLDIARTAPTLLKSQEPSYTSDLIRPACFFHRMASRLARSVLFALAAGLVPAAAQQLPQVTMTGPASVREGDPLTVTVHRTGPTAAELRGGIVFVDTASNGDFNARSAVRFPVGSATDTVRITVQDDDATPATRTITASVSTLYATYVVGNPSSVTVTVIDKDATDTPPSNNAPVFTEGTRATRSIAENTAPGQNIGGPVTATDLDSGDTLTYSLSGTDASSFSINNSTGQLLTRAALDYETQSSYAVTVSVSDGRGGSDSINVTITVTVATDPASLADREVLVAFYNATGGANWRNSTNWLSNEPLSSWYGVNTDEDGRVTRLWFYGNQLSGEIPPELGNLTNLREMTLSASELSGEIPPELGNLTNLRELFLYDNQLTGEIPPELGNLTNLDFLLLGNNQLTGEIPPELGDLANLEILSLTDNQLTGEIPAELGNLTNLRELFLSYNQLTGEIAPELGDLPNLRQLFLRNNQLSGEIAPELGNLAKLEYLSLSRNTLTGEIPAELGNLTNLQRLFLWRNQLTGKIPPELGNLAKLDFLALYDNELSGAVPPELGNLAKLQKLFLHDNGLSGPLPLTLSALSQLSLLNIESTSLCAPTDTAFQAWLATINFQGSVCATRPPFGGGGGGGGGFGGGGGSGGGPRTSVPGAVRNLTAVGGNGEVVLGWDAPASDGGEAITDYEYRINGQNPWISIGSTETTHTVTGLVNGTEYTFQVRAVNRVGKSFAPNQVETTPEAPEVLTLDFAHFANGEGTTSDLVFVNVAPQPVRPALYFYDTEGAPIAAESVVDVTGDLEVQEDGGLTVLTEMEPLGELTIATHGQGELVSGSVTVVSNAPIGGMLRYDLPHIGEAVVGASPPVSDALFAVRRREGGITTGVAVHNRESSPGLVHCDLLREGVLLDAVSIPLEANGQTAWLIDQAFPAADTSDFAGSVQCDAGGEGLFSALALEMDPGTRIFTTLPVFPVDRGGGGREAALDFAHFANGDGTTSDLVFVNLSTERSRPAPTPFHTDIPPIRPAIYFYDTEGNPIAAESVVDLAGDLVIQENGALTVLTEMEPLGVLTVSTHGRGELVSGSVKVVSGGPIGGMLRYNLPHIGEAVVGASPPVSDAVFPVRRQEGGINTGVAIHNLESSPGLVHCDLLREGVLLDAVSIPLEANGQTSWLIDQAFPGTDTSDFAGVVRCDAVGEGLFSAVALEMDPATRIFTTLPVVPVPERILSISSGSGSEK